jgi:phospholipase A1
MSSSQFPVSNSEFDFQISFKVPLWQDIFVWPDTLYMAYTQDSFWQLYTDDPYFRETDYQPEIYLDNKIDKSLGDNWYLSDLDLGAMHQSNGRGGATERSWNRTYFNTVFNNGNWMVSIEPWTPIFAKESSDEHNPDITHYLGYGEEMLAYNYDNNTFSLTTRNVLESGFSRGAEWLTWSFPLIHRNFKGYVYLFSGYGYDLIDYNHYTNGAGLGITLNDWM